MTEPRDLGPEDMENRFTYHNPSEERATHHLLIREKGRAFAELVVAHVPASRERSLAVTKIEEAVMWANAAIARQGEEETHDDRGDN